MAAPNHMSGRCATQRRGRRRPWQPAVGTWHIMRIVREAHSNAAPSRCQTGDGALSYGSEQSVDKQLRGVGTLWSSRRGGIVGAFLRQKVTLDVGLACAQRGPLYHAEAAPALFRLLPQSAIRRFCIMAFQFRFLRQRPRGRAALDRTAEKTSTRTHVLAMVSNRRIPF